MNVNVLQECLSRLMPHVDETRIALTGSVAISIHLDGAQNDPQEIIAAHDVDFVAESVDGIRETVTSDFLVSHFHRPHPGYPKFLIQLVDPATRLRLDFFPDTLGTLSRARIVDVAGVRLRTLDAADILDHKLRLVSGASDGNRVEEKHYADAKRLGAMCERDVPTISPSQLVSTAYSQDLEEPCPRCEVSTCDAFPLAPKRAIFDVLGYV